MPAFADPLTARIVEFLRGVGLQVHARELATPGFLPGIAIGEGALLIDEAKLLYPGDLLHEAGHLAVKTTIRREKAGADAGKNVGEEIAAIAWSWAALTHLGLDPATVFHPDGYKGGASSLIENFSAGRFIGLPLLQWMGLTLDERNASEQNQLPFPHMLRWLRE